MVTYKEFGDIFKIGAGLGGLQWADVREVIERVTSDYPDIELIVVENYRPE